MWDERLPDIYTSLNLDFVKANLFCPTAKVESFRKRYEDQPQRQIN